MNASPPRSSLARKRHRWNRKKEGVNHEHDTTHTPMKASFYPILLVYLWTVWARISADLRLSFLRITRTRSMCSFHRHITFKVRGQRKEGKQRRGEEGEEVSIRNCERLCSKQLILASMKCSTAHEMRLNDTTVQHSTALRGTVYYSIIQYSAAKHSAVQRNTVQRNTAPLSVVQYSTVQ